MFERVFYETDPRAKEAHVPVESRSWSIRFPSKEWHWEISSFVESDENGRSTNIEWLADLWPFQPPPRTTTAAAAAAAPAAAVGFSFADNSDAAAVLWAAAACSHSPATTAYQAAARANPHRPCTNPSTSAAAANDTATLTPPPSSK